MHKLIRNKYFFFYSITTLVLFGILFSTPFLRYPYDMFHHLIVIDNLYTQLVHPVDKMTGIWSNDIFVMVPTGEHESITLARPRYLWHYGWALLFDMFSIDSTQMFLRAKIIHVVQTYISLFSIYYFSKVVIRNTIKNITEIDLKYLSLWSVIIWVTLFATFSVAYHQVWLLWYSVNYQITLPLSFYMLGLTLTLLLEEMSLKKKLFFIVQILILSRFILQVHSMEFLYYMMYIAVFSLVFIDKIYGLLKKYFYIIVPLVFSVVYMAKHYQPEKSQLFNYLSLNKLPQLHEIIMQKGAILLSGYNRASASVNELMYFILYLGIMFIGCLLWQKYKQREITIHFRLLLFLVLTSAFVLIPLYQFSGGLFSMITYTMVVNRLYYSASLFVLIPIFTYAFLPRYKLRYVNLLIVVFLALVLVFSKYSNVLNHNYYKNIVSIENAFDERKVGFNLTKEQIAYIGQIIKEDEKDNTRGKQIKYYARADIAFVIKYMYKRNVYWEGRRANPDYKSIYEMQKDNKNYRQILFKTPEGFPSYSPYM